MTDKDPFGLVRSVEHKVNPQAEEILDICEVLTRIEVLNNPSATEAYSSHEALEFPVFRKDKKHSFQLVRSPEESDQVTYTYRRLGAGYEKSGFRITSVMFGATFLSSNDPDVASYEDNDQYAGDILEAKKQIDKYIKGIGVSEKIIDSYKNVDISDISKKSRLKRVINALSLRAPFYIDNLGNVHRYKGTGHKRDQRKVLPGRNHIKYGRLAALASLLPMPFYGSSLVEIGDVALPKPATIEVVDDILNSSEHIREGYDSRKITLPNESSTIVTEGEPTLLDIPISKLPPKILEELSDAPAIDADGDDVQDIYGGPRRLDNLGKRSGFMSDNDTLKEGSCEDIVVRFNASDEARVANVDEDLARKITFEINSDKIEVCNISDSSVDQEDLNKLYIQVYDK